MQRKISATIASQHPDHAHKPYWHTEAFISTRSETEECFRAFSELGIDEYKWDWEGKFVDEGVIERLYSEHFEYFKKQQLGVDKFVTFRLPNPKGETEVRLGRAFMGILSAAILAEKIGVHHPPLFEVILPMTETAEEMIYIQEAFAEMASLKHKLYMFHETSLKEIEMIPLFEDVETIMNSHKILEKYLLMRKKRFNTRPSLLRPYIARSDPALNSGLVPTVLATKIALSHYAAFEKKHDLPLFPILGTASLPFRGGLTPYSVEDFVNEYKGIRTALIQSAFRYDYKKFHVIKAIQKLKELLPQTTATSVSAADEKELRNILPVFEKHYRNTIEQIAPTINQLAAHLPGRRERVQHTGLFGYARGIGKVKLPRAIGFTAALYSLGVPPEFIGTGRGIASLKGKHELVETYYINFKKDLIQAGKFLNKHVLVLLAKQSSAWDGIVTDVDELEKYFHCEFVPETDAEIEHHKKVEEIYAALQKNDGEALQIHIEHAAFLRKSLG